MTKASSSSPSSDAGDASESITAIRCAIELDQQGRLAANYYLLRSRYFWNLLVTYSDEYFQQYLAEEASPESDEKIKRCLTTLYDLIAHKNLKKESVFIDPTTLSQIELIRQLPNTTLRNRVNDLFKLYVGVKLRIAEGRTTNLGKPKTKDNKSRQSIRFEPSDYLIAGDTIVILGDPELKIKLPYIRTVDFSTPHAITLNYSPKSIKLLNTIGKPKSVPFYYITIDVTSR